MIQISFKHRLNILTCVILTDYEPLIKSQFLLAARFLLTKNKIEQLIFIFPFPLGLNFWSCVPQNLSYPRVELKGIALRGILKVSQSQNFIFYPPPPCHTLSFSVQLPSLPYCKMSNYEGWRLLNMNSALVFSKGFTEAIYVISQYVLRNQEQLFPKNACRQLLAYHWFLPTVTLLELTRHYLEGESELKKKQG